MFLREDRNPFLQETAIEIRIVGDDEDDPAKQIGDGCIVDAVTGDHRIGDAGNRHDLGWDRKLRILKPLPGAQNFVDPPVLTVIFEEADAELDDLVAIGIGAGGFHIHDGGDELWTVIGWVIFSRRC
jgi:hypothetical protein